MGKDGHRETPPATASLPVWDLRRFFSCEGAPDFDQMLSALQAEVKAFSRKHKGKLEKLSGRALGLAVRDYEKIVEKTTLFSVYADLLEAQAGASVPLAASLRSRTQKARDGVLFFAREINKIPEADLIDKLAAPELAAYAPWLSRVRAFKGHQLDDLVEDYLRDRTPAAGDVWKRIFNRTVADLRFEVCGEKFDLDGVRDILRASDDADIRRDALSALTRVLGEQEGTFSLIANTLADLRCLDARWREFDAPADRQRLDDQARKEEAEAVLAAVREGQAKTSHRYYAWKAERSGRSLLHPADAEALLPPTAPALTWDAAKKIILEAFDGFSPGMGAEARRFFEENRIDAASEGKQSSAPALYTASAQTFISMRYAGTAGDVLALAKALGQGVHRSLASGRGHLTAQAPAAAAEAAGAFAQMLVFRALVAGEDDLFRRRSLLAAGIEEMLENLGGKSALFLFEQRVHEERAKKGELSPQRIARMWQEEKKAFYGPSVDLDAAGADRLWMAEKDYVHAPFHAASAAAGQCLALALFDTFGKTPDKDAFGDAFTAFLKAGATLRSDAAFLPLGVDIRDPGTWKEGVAAIGRLIDEVVALDREIETVLKSKADFRAAANDVLPPQQGGGWKKASPKGPGF